MRRTAAWAGRARGAATGGALLLITACAFSSHTRAIAPPYAYSRLITGIAWDFAPLATQRRAHGSDLWPCAWARDDNLYCAWGDGGGFNGDADDVGRVSLGFARITGSPSVADATAWQGEDVWGDVRYAAHAATFGGKVSSMTSVGGVLYGTASLWTAANAASPVHTSEDGPLKTLVWSADLAQSWQIAPWSVASGLGSFLNGAGADAGALDGWVYIYYRRDADTRHLFLKRVRQEQLQADPASAGVYQYLSAVRLRGRRVRWSAREADAQPVFADVNHAVSQDVVYDAPLRRYLLTVAHYASGNEQDASVGAWGLFEALYPWGPWATVAYYENWGNLRSSSAGDVLEVHLPAKWIGADGSSLWAVFSGLHALDAFNLVQASLAVAPPR